VDLSIIIPTYNRLWSLPETIESCRHNLAEVEIIVIDDGSSDGTWEWLARQPGVVPIFQENAGKAHAVNRGFEIASGTYVRFLDSDDMVPSGANDLQLEVAIRTSADVVVAGHQLLHDGQQSLGLSPWRHCDDFIAQQLGECDSSHYSAYLFRRSFLSEIRHRQEFAFRDDRLFVIEVAMRHPKVAVVDTPGLIHRHHDRGRIQFQPGLAAATTYWQEAQMYRKVHAMLQRAGEATARRNRAIASNLFPLAQRTAIFSMSEAHALLRWARELDPDYAVPVRRRLDRLYALLGFSAAQWLVNLARPARNMVRSIKNARRVRRQPEA
jgi:glycosyltransferase involved in cell wall biosynthesis